MVEILAAVVAAAAFKRSFVFDLVFRAWPSGASFYGCSLCLGFWFGLVASIYVSWPNYLTCFCVALIVSVCSYSVDRSIAVLESAINYLDTKTSNRIQG